MRRKKPNRPAKQTPQSKLSAVRIIAGQWRGRKLSFVSDVKGLRPTSDRTRETLFNWLQGEIYEAHCLDLFAGSGALGFEALSRGAAQVTLVEKNRQVATQLVQTSTLLEVNDEAVNIIHGDALTALLSSYHIKQRKNPPPSYHIIFLDPPFHQGLLLESLIFIKKHHLLASSGLLYMEYAADEKIDKMLAWLALSENGFVLYKQKRAGQVVSCLYHYHGQVHSAGKYD